MTNRDALMIKISAMDNKDLAEYLDGNVGDEISCLICVECQHDHDGLCIMESLGMGYCPRKTADWLQEEAAKTMIE